MLFFESMYVGMNTENLTLLTLGGWGESSRGLEIIVLVFV